jgi:hypothetical protein
VTTHTDYKWVADLAADGTVSCSATVPYTPGLETRLYGVNGYPETDPIIAGHDRHGWTRRCLRHCSAVLDRLHGQGGLRPGRCSRPTHVDFYNGDDIADCTAGA